MRVLFWNLRAKPLEKVVARVSAEHHADIIILCEHGNRADRHEETINKIVSHTAAPAYIVPSRLSQQSAFAVIARLNRGAIVPVIEERHCVIYAVTQPSGEEFMLACVHLSSPLRQSERDLMILAQDTVDLILDQENQRRHRRTLVVGDFNMDPYHPGMVASHAFHAVMDRRLAMEESRMIQNREHFFFYNPMWSRLGDESLGPSGTYFYRQASPECHFWHAWDQVLVRPALLSQFEYDKLSVISKVDSSSLLDSKGRPDCKKYSDHLPIVFEI